MYRCYNKVSKEVQPQKSRNASAIPTRCKECRSFDLICPSRNIIHYLTAYCANKSTLRHLKSLLENVYIYYRQEQKPCYSSNDLSKFHTAPYISLRALNHLPCRRFPGFTPRSQAKPWLSTSMVISVSSTTTSRKLNCVQTQSSGSVRMMESVLWL